MGFREECQATSIASLSTCMVVYILETVIYTQSLTIYIRSSFREGRIYMDFRESLMSSSGFREECQATSIASLSTCSVSPFQDTADELELSLDPRHPSYLSRYEARFQENIGRFWIMVKCGSV